MPTYRPHSTVTIGGAVQDFVFEWHTDSELDQPSTADITLALPLGGEVTEGAPVQITAAAAADDAERLVFWGRVNKIDNESSDDGLTATLRCDGWAWQLTLPLEADLVLAGGAPIDARLLSSSVLHVGNSTVAWFADPSPDGLTVDLMFSPHADARFVRVTGRQHGANSYREEPDRDIRDFSRIEVWQDGRKRGYANMPQSSEDWSNAPDYTDDSNWTDFDLTIGAAISAGGGDVTIRFISGTKPNTKERDDYEAKGISYSTAGQSTLRDLIRAILKDRGFGGSGNGVPYRIAHVYDLSGDEVLLGGNGLVNNGRITLAAESDPLSWIVQTANYWGYHVIDGPNALDVMPVRWDPGDHVPVATYQTGLNVFRFSPTSDVADVVTKWTVSGASGSDENGQAFQYQSTTDPASVAMPAFIPNPPGFVAGSVRSDLLVSDKLCRSVRQVQEVEHEALPVTVQMEVVPSPQVRPAMTVLVIDAASGLNRKMWVQSVAHDWSSDGFWSTVTTRVASGQPNPEADVSVDPRTAPSTATRHVGQVTIAWYARNGPDGLSVSYPFDPGGPFRGVEVIGRYHGANSFKSGSKPATPSTVEVWQFGTKIGSADLPWHPERYSTQLDYTNDANWADFDLVIACDLQDASAEIRFASGTARDSSRDEFEVKGLTVQLYAEATEQSPVETGGADWFAYQAKRRFRQAS